MKKRTKAALLGLGLSAALLFSACQKQEPEETQPAGAEQVPNYQGALAEGESKSEYDQSLFYRNDKKADGADPFVLDNTARDGYYYMYTTWGGNFCYRSTNLMDREQVGNALDLMHYENGQPIEERRVTRTDIWAPEVVYDEETELYYLFFSATPEADNSVTASDTVASGSPIYQLLVATSKLPYRDFRLVNFLDADSCGAENVHTYDQERYPHYFAKYLMMDPSEYSAFGEKNACTFTGGGYVGAIDPHPFVDEDGQKYLYWVDNVGENGICVVRMENWLKPDWSTATKITFTGYYTMEDYYKARQGQSVEWVSYENNGNKINEGPEVLKRNGKYYLTFSVNGYDSNAYQVGIAVADNVLGPYRKLTEAEGGLMLSGNVIGSQEISGTGHHSFVTVGDSLYIIYHRHNDPVVAGGARNPAVDEVKWITVKDKDGADLDVPYVNGPTDTVQPILEAFAEYKNIAPEATVTASGSVDAAALTDGLLSVQKYGNPTLMEYIPETHISETTTFTFDFAQARTVRAVMVYNSKDEYSAFRNISKVEFVCQEDGKEGTKVIENIPFSTEYYQSNDFDGSMFYIIPGAAAYAEFDALTVTSVRITVEVPEGQSDVGLSEIRILGK